MTASVSVPVASWVKGIFSCHLCPLWWSSLNISVWFRLFDLSCLLLLLLQQVLLSWLDAAVSRGVFSNFPKKLVINTSSLLCVSENYVKHSAGKGEDSFIN